MVLVFRKRRNHRSALLVCGLVLLLVGGPCLVHGANLLRADHPTTAASVPAEEEVNEEYAVAFASVVPDVVGSPKRIELPSSVEARLLACAAPEVEVPPPRT